MPANPEPSFTRRPRILALTACRNRREATQRSVEAVMEQLQQVADGAICAVDDGSTDGTRDMLRTEFQSIKLICADGNAFWAGAMRLGWTQWAAGQEFDYLLVFNDDVVLANDALEQLIAVANRARKIFGPGLALVAPFADTARTGCTYGGVVRRYPVVPTVFRRLIPNGEDQLCATLNMNFSLIDRYALRLTDFLDPVFVHRKADYDFGLRLQQAGGHVVMAPNYLGHCDRNPAKGSSAEAGLAISERLRRAMSQKEDPPKILATYLRRHSGWVWPALFAAKYARAVIAPQTDSEPT